MSEEMQQPSGGVRVCAYCGKPFHPLVPSTKYCTSLCRRKSGQERRAKPVEQELR